MTSYNFEKFIYLENYQWQQNKFRQKEFHSTKYDTKLLADIPKR